MAVPALGEDVVVFFIDLETSGPDVLADDVLEVAVTEHESRVLYIRSYAL